MKTVALLGLGLMNGSLGLALKARGAAGRVRGYARRPETRDQALRRGVVDEAFDAPERAVEGADLVVLGTPILAMPGLVESCRNRWAPGCLVTDVGSTKVFLEETLPGLLAGTGALFIGSHPIAGSERQGLEAARAELYEGAVVIITPGAGAPAPAADGLAAFWEGVGGRVHRMTPSEHDAIMARTSHLPHLAAVLLAATVARGGEPRRWGPYCGGGFVGTTRIAEGSAEVWHDILRTNAGPVAEELRALGREAEQLSGLMERGRFDIIKEYLGETRRQRRTLLKEREGEPEV